MTLILLSLPWILVALYLILFFRNPKPVPGLAGGHAEALPYVSVIVLA